VRPSETCRTCGGNPNSPVCAVCVNERMVLRKPMNERPCSHCGMWGASPPTRWTPDGYLLVWDEKPEPVCRICDGWHIGLGLCLDCCRALNEAPKDGTLVVLVEERL